MYGAIYSIEGMIKQIEKELKTNVDVILTGGFSVLISPKISIRHTLKPNLTLDGIREIFKENN